MSEINQHTKQSIFDIFYIIKDTSRSGGGKIHKKMARRNVSIETINSVKKTLDPPLLKYFEKLSNRQCNLAPPPRPK